MRDEAAAELGRTLYANELRYYSMEIQEQMEHIKNGRTVM